jgi:hypothetical protein
MLLLHAASSLTGSAATLADRLSAWRVQRTIEGLRVITVTETSNYFRAWTSPNPDTKGDDKDRRRHRCGQRLLCDLPIE